VKSPMCVAAHRIRVDLRLEAPHVPLLHPGGDWAALHRSFRRRLFHGRYFRRWPWILALLASLLLWVPAIILFPIATHLWPKTGNGASGSYYLLLGWQIAWIFLGIPTALIATLVFIRIGRRSTDEKN
jgi:hypothetical protein